MSDVAILSKSNSNKIASNENEQPAKRKHRSRLSLNTEVKHKGEFKKDVGQASIKTFFENVSSKMQDANINGENLMGENSEDANSFKDSTEKDSAILIDNKTGKNVASKKKSQKKSHKVVEEIEGNVRKTRIKKPILKEKETEMNFSKEIETINDEDDEKQNFFVKTKKKPHFSEDLTEFEPIKSQATSEKRTKRRVTKNNIKLRGAFNNAEATYLDTEEIAKTHATAKPSEVKELYEGENSNSTVKNAFTFMMDNRYKSIGQNSPGRELDKSQEVNTENKKIMSARKAIFQEWADIKGGKKRKIEDDEKGEIIEHKLKRRAKRLKKLLTRSEDNDVEKIKNNTNIIELDLVNDTKSRVKVIKTSDKDNINIDLLSDNSLETETFVKRKLRCKRSKVIVFSDSSNETDMADEKLIKPSTPLQQMELSSFFARLNKQSECDLKEEESNESNSSNCNCVDENTLKIDEISKISVDNESIKDDCLPVLSLKNIKRWQMRLKMDLSNVSQVEIKSILDQESNKKILEEDQGLKNDGKNIKETVVVSSDLESDNEQLSKRTIKVNTAKLAPLFVRAKQKPKLDKETIEARKKFLHSSIPDSLKKTNGRKERVEEIEYEIFPAISHVKVKPPAEELMTSSLNFWCLPPVELELLDAEPCTYNNLATLSLGSVTCSALVVNNRIESQLSENITNIKSRLKQIKEENPEYPVFKAFKSLYQKRFKNSYNEVESIINKETKIKNTKKTKKSKSKQKHKRRIVSDNEETESIDDVKLSKMNIRLPQQIWTELYKPSVSKEIFGNSKSISQLSTWLKTWLEFSEEINSENRRKHRNSGSSSDFEDADGDSRSSSRLPGNAVILHGPHGTGKTMTVYALCNEFDINVLEINCSSKRTGKRLLQELQEATQSHQVRKLDILTSLMKNEDKSTSSSQSSNSDKRMCLLLIEDVDIVFEQDENFITALSQLLNTSKRPIVLTTTDSNCLHLRKFFNQYPVINFSPLSAKVLATWLQIVCLIEGLHIARERLVELLARNKGDVRTTLLQMQFWLQNVPESKFIQSSCWSPSKAETSDGGFNDDSSNISWLNEGEQSLSENALTNSHLNIDQDMWGPIQLNLGSFWWKLSSRLNNPRTPMKTEEIETEKTKTCCKDLEGALNIFETFAIIDVLHKRQNIDFDLEPVHRNRNKWIKNSTELTESMENYCASKDLFCDWSQTIFDGYKKLCYYEEYDFSMDNNSEAEKKQWVREQYRSEDALMEAVPLFSRFDHSSIHLDYLSSLRTIARTELVRSNNNNKRRNRFYNYLRGVGVCDDDCAFSTASNVFRYTEI